MLVYYLKLLKEYKINSIFYVLKLEPYKYYKGEAIPKPPKTINSIKEYNIKAIINKLLINSLLYY